MSELAVGQLKGLAINNNTITVPSGHKLYAPGSVVQVVSSTYAGGEIGNSSNTYIETNVTATITPRFANSRLIIRVEGNVLKNNTNASNGANVRLLRGESVVKTVTSMYVTNTTVENGGPYSFTYVDTPNTVSSVTYRTQFANAVNSSVVVHGRGHDGTITIMEVAV
jgi:hypothetical protein